MGTLTELFTKSYNVPYRHNDYVAGYQEANLDLLLQQAKRNKSVRESRLWDYVQVENDPNFSRRYNSAKLEKLSSDLSVATQLTTVINSKLSMAGVHEFIPAGMREFLINFQQIADTNINLMSTFKQFISFNQLQDILLNDLLGEFRNGSTTFNEMVLMANTLIDNYPLLDNVKNGDLRSILSLGLQNFLPESMSSIFSDAQFLSNFIDVFEDDNQEWELFSTLFGIKTDKYTKNKTIGSYVETPTVYYDVPLGFSDPLGLSIQSKLESEMVDGITQDVDKIIDEVIAELPNDYTTEQVAQIKELIIEQITKQITTVFDQNFALPSYNSIIKAINIDSYNSTQTAINTAFQNFALVLIDELNIRQPVDEKPLDYLINVKTNIQKRVDMFSTNDKTENFVEIDTFLRNITQSNKNLSEKEISELNIKFKNYLKDNT